MANDLVVLRDEIAESGFVVAEVFLSPLPGTEPMRVKARIGSLVRDILPDCARAPMVCIIDGVPMKREWWMRRPVCEGDHIQFAPIYLGGKGGSRSILGAIAAIALSWFVPGMVAGWGGIFTQGGIVGGTLTWAGHLASAGIILVGNALISAVIGRPNNDLGQGDVASSIYSVDAQGNAARVFQPIPVQYGRMKYFPNFAAQPYSIFHQTVPDVVEVVPDILKSSSSGVDHSHGLQYYYALFCLGQGEYDIEKIQIADANIDNFQDIKYNVLKPGERPVNVNPCVVTSDAVSGMSLDEADWIGPFPICGPGRRATGFDLHFIFPQGLCKLDDKGKAKSNSVKIVAQCRDLDDYDNPFGEWYPFGGGDGTIVVNAASLTPQRRTFHTYFTSNVDGRRISKRVEVRVKRVGKKDKEDQKDMSSVQWAGLSAYLDEEAPLCKTATHLEVVMRASEQLSTVSQRKISVIATRKIPSWDSATPIATRSPARALYDKWTNSVYGDGLPPDRIDLETLKHYDKVCEERGDKFDYVFESRVSSQEGDQTIAKSMRSVALQRQGVKTIVRDELCDMPLTLFNPTNTAEHSVSLDYIQITEETTDGVIVEYFSSAKWDWDEIECPGPGRTYSNTSHPRFNPNLPSMENPARVTLTGITSGKHAEREGLYLAYTNALRRQFASWTTELQGALVYYGAPVLLSTTLYSSQQGGEIRDYDSASLTLSLTNGVYPGKLVLMRHDGSLTAPLDFDVVDEDSGTIRLREAPDFTINYGEYSRERTKYVILEGEMVRRIVKILSVTPKGIGETGAPLYELKGVVDVPEVHTVDNFLLIPDDPYVPPDTPDEPDDPDIPSGNYKVTLREVPTVLTYEALHPRTGHPASILFGNEGALRAVTYNRINGIVYTGGVPGQEQTWNHWIEPGAPIPNIGANYEIMLIARYRVTTTSSYMLYPEYPPPTQEWLDNVNRPVLDGYKLKYIKTVNASTTSSMELSTAMALNSAEAYQPDGYAFDDRPRSEWIYSDWISMKNPVWLKGRWDTFPRQYPTAPNVLMGLRAEAFDYFVAIRDKATHTVQGFQRYKLGFWRQDNSTP